MNTGIKKYWREKEARVRYYEKEFERQTKYYTKELEDKIKRLEKGLEEETRGLKFLIAQGYKTSGMNIYQFHQDEIRKLTNEKKKVNQEFIV
ncbi:hypothetical protein [Borrelia turicatae]|uniref:hypothetical protein n=1 Tax=Borrelia turicatae TaxID=142 RepID=UPI001FF4F481|nr:hypothetical protein [Borrelia turicatae]UPA14284.1 hypothetical protein bt91E135_001464 [Borrelia turicatae 91E135]